MSKGWEQMKKAREEDYFDKQNKALLEKLSQKEEEKGTDESQKTESAD